MTDGGYILVTHEVLRLALGNNSEWQKIPPKYSAAIHAHGIVHAHILQYMEEFPHQFDACDFINRLRSRIHDKLSLPSEENIRKLAIDLLVIYYNRLLEYRVRVAAGNHERSLEIEAKWCWEGTVPQLKPNLLVRIMTFFKGQ